MYCVSQLLITTTILIKVKDKNQLTLSKIAKYFNGRSKLREDKRDMHLSVSFFYYNISPMYAITHVYPFDYHYLFTSKA